MIKSTVIAVSIHDENQNPIFGEDVINLRLDDESGGGFFIITQEGKTEIRVTLDELQLIAEEAQRLLAERRRIENGIPRSETKSHEER